MKSERRAGRRGALEGEPGGGLAIREDDSLLLLQIVAIDPPDRHVLGMRRAEAGGSARLEQLSAAQRESAVADVVAVAELRPRRADIVALEEALVPLGGVDHEPIPLDQQTMVGAHMVCQPAKDESRIVGRRAQRRDSLDSPRWKGLDGR